MDAAPKPVAPPERIISLDVLRGVALFGILLVNMLTFSYPFQYVEPLSWPGALDQAAEWFIRVFAQASFYTMFSFLFGLGFALQLQRATSRGGDAVPVFRRRLFILLGIGFLHAILIWTGDILVAYALTGLFLMVFRNHSGRGLARWGVAGVLFTFLLTWFGLTIDGSVPKAYIARVTEVYSAGTYLEVTLFRVQEFALLLVGVLFGIPQLLALFFIGLWAGRQCLLEALDYLFIRRVMGWALVIGLIGKVPYAFDLLTGAFTPVLSSFFFALSFIVSGPAIGFFYMGILLLLLRSPVWQQRLSPFALAGRMALSNYLMQSLICTTLFYGYGFGLYGQVGPALGVLLTLVIFSLQVLFSRWWLSRYRYGPMEWLWRSLTYGEAQPQKPATIP
jgi:uncharacterized protein